MKEEDRAREVLQAHAGYEISRWDMQDNCSVLAKHAVRAMLAFATPAPVIETEGSGEDDVEPWQQEAARQLGLLYNYHHDDRHQFTRWQMMTAIAHGSKLAGGSLDLRPVGAENVRENKALGGADAQPALVNEAPTGLHPTGFDQAQGDGE